METISESIRADVPPRFADRMWSEFVFRSRSAGRPRSMADARWWVDESTVEKGQVKFAREGEGLRVTVELQCDPRAGGGDSEMQTRDRLRHDLESYRTFLDERCEATDCRAGRAGPPDRRAAPDRRASRGAPRQTGSHPAQRLRGGLPLAARRSFRLGAVAPDHAMPVAAWESRRRGYVFAGTLQTGGRPTKERFA